jgi:CRP/FNR family transcriptional regulator, cyclic AMP receptor protein
MWRTSRRRACPYEVTNGCNPDVRKHVPLFAFLDEDETAVLAGQVEIKTFAVRQRIYKIGEPGGRACVMVSGQVKVTTIDADQQAVVVDEPTAGELFGLPRCSPRGKLRSS